MDKKALFNDTISIKTLKEEEITIEDLHDDLEERLREQGFIFDRRKFVFQDKDMTFGEKLADGVAKFGGSWKFIMVFGLFIIAWIVLNLIVFMNRGFDPYPFILLNLILSCIASLQAPIIIMSQNRQAQKDKRQEEVLIEKDIVDFKQDRLDLILDQKEWEILRDMDRRLKRIEDKLDKKTKR